MKSFVQLVSLMLIGFANTAIVFAQESASGQPMISTPPKNYEQLALLGRIVPPRATAPNFALGDSHIVFSYEPQTSAEVRFSRIPSTTKFVALAFGHEGYSRLHTFLKAGSGVYYYVWDFDRETRLKLAKEGKQLEYRLIVDGSWIPDPSNPLSIRKLNGAMVSYVDISTAPSLPLLSPELGPFKGLVRLVTLRLKAKPQSEVFVGGTFNNFDPYLNTLQETQPGLYTIELRLLPGQYFYYFVVDGKPVLDSLNPVKGYGLGGKAYSRLIISKDS